MADRRGASAPAKGQQAALTDCTRGATDDSACTYKDINRLPRDGKGGNAQISSQIEQMDKALAGCKVPEDVVVSRGVDLTYPKLHPSEMPGEVFTEDGFMSTSLGNLPAGGDASAILHLKVPGGTDGMFLGKREDRGHSLEAEAIGGAGLAGRGRPGTVHARSPPDGCFVQLPLAAGLFRLHSKVRPISDAGQEEPWR